MENTNNTTIKDMLDLEGKENLKYQKNEKIVEKKRYTRDQKVNIISVCKDEIRDILKLSCEFFASQYSLQFLTNPLYKLLIIENHSISLTNYKFFRIPNLLCDNDENAHIWVNQIRNLASLIRMISEARKIFSERNSKVDAFFSDQVYSHNFVSKLLQTGKILKFTSIEIYKENEFNLKDCTAKLNTEQYTFLEFIMMCIH